ncbi:hypothetical protein [Desulfopila sp. IMCC35008]|uniref:hypothetical protein n=1 Tax=Desulfopila sp. IMCC35008 TaxID=2653858 RepID=UPI0013D5F776|nr:hypothetical protein [Desulfopila sp. IMCC35008]
MCQPRLRRAPELMYMEYCLFQLPFEPFTMVTYVFSIVSHHYFVLQANNDFWTLSKLRVSGAELNPVEVDAK